MDINDQGKKLAVIATVFCIVLAIWYALPKPDHAKIFENKLVELQSLFTNQTDRFWRIVKNRGLVHLRNANPSQPLVLLLAAPPAAHGVVDCLARKLAKALDPRHKRMLATIDGTKEKRFAGEKAKKKMNKLLTDKFRAGHRVALIHHLGLLPPPSPLLFYSYCNDRNAPHKHVAFIFTVHLPAEPDASLSPREAEGTVEKYLSSKVWAREDQDAVAALLSHVADTVALVNGEPDYFDHAESFEEGTVEKYLSSEVWAREDQDAVAALLSHVADTVALVNGEPDYFDHAKSFEEKLAELQSLFTNQTDRFWRIIKNHGLVHLRNKNPPQPLVLLLAAPPAAHGLVDCLAKKLAEVLDPRHKRMLATIDGTEEKRFAGEKVKKKMDELLTAKFRAGHRVALIHHFELLPPPSPLLFYSYCNDRNAPHKHVAFIFTVHLPAEPDASLSPREAEGTVDKYLSSEVWAREDQDAVAALLTHVANTVALMNGEPDLVKAFC